MLRIRTFTALVALAALTACTGSLDSADAVLMEVGPQKAPCSGEGITECMLVRVDGQTEWQFFYDGIEGFQYEEGFRWLLRVEVTPVHNPPADGSSRRYRLMEIVSREPDPS